MVLKESDSKSAAELAAEATGRDVSEFEAPEDYEFPELDDLEEHDADEFYSGE